MHNGKLKSILWPIIIEIYILLIMISDRFLLWQLYKSDMQNFAAERMEVMSKIIHFKLKNYIFDHINV